MQWWLFRGARGHFPHSRVNTPVSSAEALDSSLHGPSDVDDQHDYDSVASDEDTDQEPLRSANAARNNRARVSPPGKRGCVWRRRRQPLWC